MTTFIKRLLGWVTPVAPRSTGASAATTHKRSEPVQGCLAVRQGWCSGIEYCHACAWYKDRGRR